MLYAKSTGGFYDTAIHGKNIPVDAVEITAEEHAAMLNGQAIGKRIAADANGKPVLTMPPPKTPAEIVAEAKAAAAKRIAEIRLELVDLIADKLNGTPAEQAAANGAIGLLRAELALNKTKL